MGKKSTDIDILEKQVREQKSVIRHLQKQLKKLSRGYRKHRLEEVEPEPEPICPDCGKGVISEFNILGRVFKTCKVCGFREKV